MGNLSSGGTRANAASVQTHVEQLNDVIYQKSLGDARFLKAVRCKHPHGLIVVKMFGRVADINLKPYIAQLEAERKVFNS